MLTCLKFGHLNEFPSSKSRAKVVNKTIETDVFLQLQTSICIILQQNKDYNMSQNDSSQNWYNCKCQNIPHNVFDGKYAILWHCFSCKSRNLINSI